MRISPTATALAGCLALVLPLSSCSLLDQLHRSNRISENTATAKDTAATPKESSSPSVETLKNLVLFKKIDLGMKRQDCSFDASTSHDRELALERYIQDEKTCLEKAWQAPLLALNATPSPQHSNTQYTRQSSYDTSCVKNVTTTSAECREEGVVFQVSNDSYYYSDNSVNTPWSFVEISTTYSFWLLDAFNVNDTVNKLMEKVGTGTVQANEIHRRYFLSAYCLAGVYLGAQYRDDPNEQDFFNIIYNNTDNVIADASRPAPEDNTPTGQHMIDWFRKGVDTNKLSVCNTWAAPASEVS